MCDDDCVFDVVVVLQKAILGEDTFLYIYSVRRLSFNLNVLCQLCMMVTGEFCGIWFVAITS